MAAVALQAALLASMGREVLYGARPRGERSCVCGLLLVLLVVDHEEAEAPVACCQACHSVKKVTVATRQGLHLTKYAVMIQSPSPSPQAKSRRTGT